ncbi:transporter [Ganoderma sinense ZZ0214-1]|uniref:Transporter n=1 Tax=Ganoderma sinense ZZ0214-1 TaxID=1077348 RepID=A0A2G8SFF6_9APHY|nr:transporter [Ganoderma sinense ZZ0214-1]
MQSTRIDPNLKALIVIIGLDDIWDGTHPLAHHFLTTLPNRTLVRHAKTPTEALRYLNSTTRPYAIVVSDGAVLRSEHGTFMPKLVHYARDGGTVIFDGAFAQRVGPTQLRAMFLEDWRLPWRAHEESIAETALNTFTNSNAKGKEGRIDTKGLSGKYMTCANWIKDVVLEDALHVDARVAAQLAAGKRRDKKGWRPPRGETYKTPYAFTVMGRGRMGYVGDVLYDQRSVKLIAAMCLYPGSRAHRPLGTGVPPPGPVEHKGPVEDVRRPHEFGVTLRCLQRETVKARKRRLAEKTKDEANVLFREGAWLQAAQLYRASAVITAPEPTYMSNLAAALLKLELWKLAEGATSRALLHDPKHIKALYRRALARKELGLIDDAKSDISRLLAIEPDNVPALAEQQILQRLQTTSTPEGASSPPAAPGRGSGKRPARARQTEAEDRAIEIEYPSDTDDYEHEGNGISCRLHNRAPHGCKYGAARCMFRHAPDWKSVRDDIGRNVCVYWLVGTCGKAATGTCLYAHDGAYLPHAGGWWTDTGRLDRLRAEFDAAARASPLDLGAGRVKESILAEALIPASFMQDAWVYADFTSRPGAGREEEDQRGSSDDSDSGSEMGEDERTAMEAYEYEIRAMRLFEMVAHETELSMEEKELVLKSGLEQLRFGL